MTPVLRFKHIGLYWLDDQLSECGNADDSFLIAQLFFLNSFMQIPDMEF